MTERFRLELDVPLQEPAGAPVPRPRDVARWLDDLPLANPAQAGRKIHQALYRFNRTPMEPGTRGGLLRMFRAPVDALIDTIRPRYLTTPLPLTERAAASAAAVRELLAEMACGYKILAGELTLDGRLPPEDVDALAACLQGATEYLARYLLESYLVYIPEPAGIWGELHRLYRYAERERLHTVPGRGGEPVEKSYLRIVLVALADPYRLMQSEALNVYGHLGQWAAAARLLEPAPETPVSGRFFVDLGADAPPRYVPRDSGAGGIEPRILDLSGLLEVLAERIRAYTADEDRDPEEGGSAASLGERLERDMLLRLERAWGGVHERRARRKPRLSRVVMAVGLSASHHFISGGAPFMPERDEIRIHRRGAGKAGPALSLMPKEYEPWRADEEEARLLSGIQRPRSSQFDTESKEMDIWLKVYATASRMPEEEQPAEPAYSENLWRQKNEGPDGLALFCNECSARVQVGELVVYRPEAQARGPRRVGTIRWLRMVGERSLELGVMRIAPGGRAVAVRAVEGPGKGGEYFRALLVPGGHPRDEGVSLIVPSAIYDVGTVLALNLGDEILYVRLLRLVETTRSFSQFTYGLVEVPRGEQEKIQSIRAM